MRAIVALAAALLSSTLLACAPRVALRPLGADETLSAARGYTVRPPAGPWYFGSGGRLGLVLARSPTFPAPTPHTVLAITGAFDGGTEPGPEALWRAFRLWVGEFHDARFKAVAESYEPWSGPGKDCIRFQLRFEDRGVPGKEGELFVMRERGVACRHPRFPDVAAAVRGSERIPPGEEPLAVLDGEWGPFLSSLSFTPERPTASAASRTSGFPVVATAAYGGVWVTTRDGFLVRMDPRTPTIAARYPVGKAPLLAVAAEGSLWVTDVAQDAPALHRVDPGTGKVLASIAVPGTGWIAGGPGAVFLSGPKGVFRVDAGTNAITPLRQAPHGGIAVQGGKLWVMEPASGSLLALDPATGVESAPPIPVGTSTSHVVVADGALYVITGAPAGVARVDLEKRAVTATYPSAAPPTHACVRGGALWTSHPREGALRSVDLATGKALDEVPAPYASMLVCDGAAIWASITGGRNEVIRLVP